MWLVRKKRRKRQRDQTTLKTLLENLGPVGRKLAGFVTAKTSAEPVILRPEGKECGCVVLSYITWPFREGWDSPKARGHTNAFEVVAMAEAWRDRGFRVEVCDYNDDRYVPPSDCRVAIDLRANLERWDDQLRSDCAKILHATGCHWRVHNAAELSRIERLRDRKGALIKARRQVPPNLGAETADQITVLGNEHTLQSYHFTGKRTQRIPISSAYTFPWRTDRDFEKAKSRFLWLGSYGMVHKGLDLVLDAFAGMPDLHLTVCGRPEKEEDFFRIYQRHLEHSPNIQMVGWTDMTSGKFAEIAATHAGVVYPSSAEGGAGCVIHCMHSGLVPLCTEEASVDIEDFGLLIREGSVEAVAEAVRRLADLPEDEVRARCRASFDHVNSHHTREVFRRNYKAFVGSFSH